MENNQEYYNDDYYNMMYAKQSKTAQEICGIRWGFIKDLGVKSVLDYGCGCNFMTKYSPGDVTIDSFDIMPRETNPKKTGITKDYYDLTFFNDVLEHIDWVKTPDKNMLNLIGKSKYICVSVPILPEGKDFSNWKHNRPNEHLTTFTIESLDKFFEDKHFYKIKEGYPESNIREDIYTAIYKKKDVIINQFNKIGDLLFSMTYFQELTRRGHKVICPVYPWILQLQKHFPEIVFIDKSELNIGYEEQRVIVNKENIIIPLRFSNVILNRGRGRNHSLKSKYDFLNKIFHLDIPYTDWIKMNIVRDTSAENSLYRRYYTEEYNFVNRNWAMLNNVDIKIENSIEMVSLDGYSLIDWSKLLENAKSIHTVSTSIVFIIDLLKTTDDLHLYRRTSEPNTDNVIGFLNKKWEQHDD
jgi:hypothetical protein